jgi:glycerol-3-phosphate dehydrogenase
VPETVVMTEGKRILFAIPWAERTILGTTDTDYRGSLDDVRADADDVSYILRVANQFFPAARLIPADVISTWAGLRPLQSDPHGKPSEISRAHEISSPEAGWWDVTGGKLTTYRLMAQETMDRVTHWLALQNAVSRSLRPCQTDTLPLLAATDVAVLSGIVPPEFNRRVVAHACANEWAIHLDDVMIRRTNWQYYFRDAAARAERVASWMAELLGWSDSQRAAELSRYDTMIGRPVSQPATGDPALADNTATTTEPSTVSR